MQASHHFALDTEDFLITSIRFMHVCIPSCPLGFDLEVWTQCRSIDSVCIVSAEISLVELLIVGSAEMSPGDPACHHDLSTTSDGYGHQVDALGGPNSGSAAEGYRLPTVLSAQPKRGSAGLLPDKSAARALSRAQTPGLATASLSGAAVVATGRRTSRECGTHAPSMRCVWRYQAARLLIARRSAMEARSKASRRNDPVAASDLGEPLADVDGAQTALEASSVSIVAAPCCVCSSLQGRQNWNFRYP